MKIFFIGVAIYTAFFYLLASYATWDLAWVTAIPEWDFGQRVLLLFTYLGVAGMFGALVDDV